MSFNLPGPIGCRERYTYEEAAAKLGFTRNQIKWFIQSGRLRVRYPRTDWPIDMHDARRFILGFNNGHEPAAGTFKPAPVRRPKKKAKGRAKSSPQSRGIPVERASARGLERAG